MLFRNIYDIRHLERIVLVVINPNYLTSNHLLTASYGNKIS